MDKAFSTTLLDQALEREKKEREELRLQLIEKLFNTLDKLRQEIPFQGAYLFGSIVKPYRFSKGSDVDIGFTGLNDKYFFKAMSFISREVGIDVDVIQLEGHRLAEKIKKDGIRWTRKD
jgi:predicted nucleotidyltransferase